MQFAAPRRVIPGLLPARTLFPQWLLLSWTRKKTPGPKSRCEGRDFRIFLARVQDDGRKMTPSPGPELPPRLLASQAKFLEAGEKFAELPQRNSSETLKAADCYEKAGRVLLAAELLVSADSDDCKER